MSAFVLNVLDRQHCTAPLPALLSFRTLFHHALLAHLRKRVRQAVDTRKVQQLLARREQLEAAVLGVVDVHQALAEKRELLAESERCGHPPAIAGISGLGVMRAEFAASGKAGSGAGRDSGTVVREFPVFRTTWVSPSTATTGATATGAAKPAKPAKLLRTWEPIESFVVFASVEGRIALRQELADFFMTLGGVFAVVNQSSCSMFEPPPPLRLTRMLFSRDLRPADMDVHTHPCAFSSVFALRHALELPVMGEGGAGGKTGKGVAGAGRVEVGTVRNRSVAEATAAEIQQQRTLHEQPASSPNLPAAKRVRFEARGGPTSAL